MGRRRGSEQFVWDDAKVRRLRGYVGAGMIISDCARRLGTSPANVSEKMKELGLNREQPKWAAGQSPNRFKPDAWGQL